MSFQIQINPNKADKSLTTHNEAIAVIDAARHPEHFPDDLADAVIATLKTIEDFDDCSITATIYGHVGGKHQTVFISLSTAAPEAPLDKNGNYEPVTQPLNEQTPEV